MEDKDLYVLPVKVIVGSLVLSPLLTQEENIEKFNQWLLETYE